MSAFARGLGNWFRWIAPLALVLLGAIVYSNTLDSEFVFDDFPHIVENPIVHDLSLFTHPERLAGSGASALARSGLSSRPVSLFTLALNYRFHGLDVRGYHLVNLLIHLLAGMLLFRLVLRTLSLPLFEGSPLQEVRGSVAWFVAALFLVHPLQTQAVTYIVQRMASLAGMLCLLALLAYLESRLQRDSLPRRLAYSVSLVALVAAMFTKENAATFPFVIAGFELLFFSGPRSRRLVRLLPLLATSALVPLRMILGTGLDPALLGSALESVRAGTTLSRDHYLWTQAGVLLTYLRLLVWPTGQNLDPERAIQTEFWQAAVVLPFAALLLLAAAGVWAIRRSAAGDAAWRLVGFGILWFFLTISVESSLIPITDLQVEHRVYLPSVGIFLAAVTAIHRIPLRGRSAARAVALLLVVFAFAATAYARNETWRSRLSIWGDSAAKSPGKPRPQILFAGALADAGRTEDAIAAYRKAVVLGPGHYRAWTNLGNLLLEVERPGEALAAFDGALAAEPRDLFAQNGRGMALRRLGRTDEAIATYMEALRVDPDYASARNNLGNALRESGRPDLAIREFEAALRLLPDSPVIRRNLELAREEAAARAHSTGPPIDSR